MDIARRLLLALLVTAPFAGGSNADEARWSGLIAELLGTGVSIGEATVKLSKPIVDPFQPGGNRESVQTKLGGSRGWKQFTRDSVVGPIYIDLDYLRGDNSERTGVRAHFAFVVHADLETLRDDDVMRQMFVGESDASSSEGFQSESIEHWELQSVGIGSANRSSYAWLELVLLKKIAIHGVMQSERVEERDHFAVAWRLDERFTDRKPPIDRYRNEWSKLGRDNVGNPTVSSPQPYAGAAGYLIVSRLDAVEGASFVEAEVVLHEPKEWFSGSNLLRSKLPLIIQESARKLRRGLK